MQALAEPPFPETLAYLYHWAHELHGRCGVSMGGVLPVSHTEIRAWSALSGHAPDVLELQALRVLDAVMSHPEPKAEKQEKPVREERAWPTRRAQSQT